MGKYTVVIEELVADEFEVEANDCEEALRIAEEKYRNCEFVLSPGEVQFKQMAVVSPNCKDEWEWCEF